MSTSAQTMAFLLDQLASAGPISSRRMFGEYCLYFDGRPIGLVCNEQLFLKPSPEGQRLLGSPAWGAPFPGARPHLRLSADDWEDRLQLARLVRATFDALPPPKASVSKAPRQAQPTKGRRTSPATAPQAASALTGLPNLGPRSAQMLHDAGIRTLAQLRQLGAVGAYARVKVKSPRASLNLLWALEGALSNMPWQEVARVHRTSLLLALERALQAQAPQRPR